MFIKVIVLVILVRILVIKVIVLVIMVSDMVLVIVTVSDIVVIIRCGRQNHCPAQHGHCHDHQVWLIQIVLHPFLGQGEGQTLGCHRYTNNLGKRRKSLFKVLRVP